MASSTRRTRAASAGGRKVACGTAGGGAGRYMGAGAGRRPLASSSTVVLSAPARGEIRRRLLAWYDAHQRDLPWRRRPGDGYAQLLAEFMLQQTQVATVIAYYQRFMQRFPTIAKLAAAPLDDVLTLWSGLGYYRRARNLHAAAQAVVERHGGVVPAEVDALLALPGVGRYTAGAIASVAYDTRAAAVDGNVIRVMMRLLALAGEPGSPDVLRAVWANAEALLPRTRCGAFNQALMEIGATVCAPRSPSCLLCPLHDHCRASRAGLTERIPPPAKRAKVLPVEAVVLAIEHGDRRLFVQRPEQGLWAGLWELPTEPVASGERVGDALRRLIERTPEAMASAVESVGSVTRQLTHRRYTFHVHRCRVCKTSADEPPRRWLKAGDLGGFGISRACAAVLELLNRA